jgi:hypothetical protein
MEPISETAAATFDLETGGAEGVDPTTTPAERPNRKMIKRESQTVVTDDMSKTEKELMEIHPDGTPWLMSILRAYNKQKTDLEVRRDHFHAHPARSGCAFALSRRIPSALTGHGALAVVHRGTGQGW